MPANKRLYLGPDYQNKFAFFGEVFGCRGELLYSGADKLFMHLRQFPRNHHRPGRLVIQRFREFCQEFFDPMDGLVEHDRPCFIVNLLERRLAAFFQRQKSQVYELIDGQAAAAEGGQKSGRTRDHFDRNSLGACPRDERVAGITDAGRAGVTREDEMFTLS